MCTLCCSLNQPNLPVRAVLGMHLCARVYMVRMFYMCNSNSLKISSSASCAYCLKINNKQTITHHIPHAYTHEHIIEQTSFVIAEHFVTDGGASAAVTERAWFGRESNGCAHHSAPAGDVPLLAGVGRGLC